MDDSVLSVQDLFWLEQEELDSTDNFFLPADTPPNCPKAYQHRKRMCIEGYDRMLIRLIQEQTKEMNDLRSSITQLVDESLLPPKPPPSYHHYINGQQYARVNQGVLKQAMEFLMEKGDVVEDCTPSVKDMVVTDDAASTYKKNCQNILDNATRMLRLKHQRQRNQILIQSGDALQKLIDEQNQEVDLNERIVPVQQQLQQPEPSQEQQQLQQTQQQQPQQQEQLQRQQLEEQQQPQQQEQQQQHQHLQQQQQHMQYQQWQQQQQQTPVIHSINVSRDPRIRPRK